MKQLDLTLAILCGQHGCKLATGHPGMHWDGKGHHNTPDTWTPLKRQRKQ